MTPLELLIVLSYVDTDNEAIPKEIDPFILAGHKNNDQTNTTNTTTTTSLSNPTEIVDMCLRISGHK